MKKTKGFTLLELMVVLVLVGVLAALAAPSFQSLFRESRVTSFTNDFVSSLYFARSLSISQARRTTLCTSRDGMHCEKGIHWSSGWLLFEDDANFGEIDPGEKILWFHEKLPDAFQLKGNRSVQNYISYTPEGSARSKNGGFQAGTITLSVVDVKRKIILGSGGRVRVSRVN